ncbi:TolB family protein [Lysobacter sp. CA196]|uniref:TolB family protein n=1 Tax=Lysobacter sp. CA196 TaxID=3455606 RepID=UPI003F8D1DC4
MTSLGRVLLQSVAMLAFSVAVSPPSIAIAAQQQDAPSIFSPGVISGAGHDAAPAFTPDGNTVYFGRQAPETAVIMESHRGVNGWSEPQIASFSGEWSDMEPSMAPDGSYLIYVSNRPVRPGGKPGDGFYNGKSWPGKGSALWRVRRTASGWGAPERLPDRINRSTSIYAPTVAADGSVYFMQPNSKTGNFQLFRAQLRDGQYEEPQPLSFSGGEQNDVDPAVAPDESFLIFGSRREPATKSMDLFVVFRDAKGWGTPQWLGEVVNSPTSDAEARFSPDLQTLYFSSERTVPQGYPRTREQTSADLKRIAAWDNSLYNVWEVPLQPLLAKHRGKAGRELIIK